MAPHYAKVPLTPVDDVLVEPAQHHTVVKTFARAAQALQVQHAETGIQGMLQADAY